MTKNKPVILTETQRSLVTWLRDEIWFQEWLGEVIRFSIDRYEENIKAKKKRSKSAKKN